MRSSVAGKRRKARRKTRHYEEGSTVQETAWTDDLDQGWDNALTGTPS